MKFGDFQEIEDKLRRSSIQKAGTLFFLCLLVFCLAGCSSKNGEKSDDLLSIKDRKLIYEETISPNREYVKNEEDIVNYTVEIYQGEDHVVLVNTKSNSGFFKPLQYELEFETSITESDVDLEWTTLMGNTIPKEDDQLCIAVVAISENGKVLSERKINFVNYAIEIVGEVL